MRLLVTGGAGFIGSHIVTALASGGHEPVVLDVRRPDAEGAPGDVRDAAVVERALRGVDAVCHQAAMVGAPDRPGRPLGVARRAVAGVAAYVTSRAFGGPDVVGTTAYTVAVAAVLVGWAVRRLLPLVDAEGRAPVSVSRTPSA